MSTAHELGPVPTRIPVGVELVQQLVAEQFPQWSGLPISPVANGGWDNWTFHLGPQMSVRLPAAAEYALAVEKEHYWLPRLAGQLRLPIPAPLGKGRPSAHYPLAWSIYPWIDGEPVTAQGSTDPVGFALDLADFLNDLQQIDPTDGPAPGIHNWFRGGSLRTFDAITQTALEKVQARVDVGLARAVWATALNARWNHVPAWFHGDIAPGNLLLRDGRLSAAIDFGTCGVGDPACDLAGAWTLLDAPGRAAFRERLAPDEATWARGRGWALWKALNTYDAKASVVLGAIFEEYEG